MNHLLKIFIIVAILIAVATIISVLIPDPITDQINESIIYFFGFINYLSPLINVQTVFICLKILANFFMGVLIFIFLRWLASHFQ
jgi:hypothetical protein